MILSLKFLFAKHDVWVRKNRNSSLGGHMSFFLLGVRMVFALGIVTLDVPGQELGGAKLIVSFGDLDSY